MDALAPSRWLRYSPPPTRPGSTRRIRHPWRRRFLRVAQVLCVLMVLAGLWVWFGPLPSQVLHPSSRGRVVVLDRNGLALSTTEPEVTVSDRSGGIALAARADKLARATLAAEDQRFASHPGVDALALGRAILADIRAGSMVQGGSTITQQLVKLRLGRPSRTPMAKVREAVYAVRLDRRMAKVDLLSSYLAEATYGGRTVGADAASRRWFGVPVSQLSWAQAAYLAALPQRPGAFNPGASPGAAVKRQRWVLRRLQAAGAIDKRTYEVAVGEKLHVRPGDPTAELAPHVINRIERVMATSTATSGLAPQAVRTTLDAALQRDVAGIARRQRLLLARYGASNVAVVVLDNHTGEVRAWEGSGDFGDTKHGGQIDGALTPRQTGSTVKPFVYAMAFERGAAPGDQLDDSPLVISQSGGAFKPLNYDRRFRGLVTMRVALGSSINVPTVRVLRRFGPAALGHEMQSGGIVFRQPPASYGLSLALGAAEVDLLSLTRAYAAFARGGQTLPVRLINGDSAVAKAVAATLPADPPSSEMVSLPTAFLVTDVLRDNEARSSAFGRRSALRFDFPVAAKTGTSQDFHDNWVIGYTDNITVGVWVGNFDRRPLHGATGVTGAGPVFRSVMLAAHARLEDTADDQIAAAVAVPTKLRAVTANGHTEYEWANRPATAAAVATVRLRFVDPVAGGHYVLDPAVPEVFQAVPLRAVGGRAPYAFTVDGTTATRGSWPLVVGSHSVCVRDAAALTVCTTITVKR